MSVYDINGNELFSVYNIDGSALSQAYDINGNELFSTVISDIAYNSAHANGNIYAGGLIEIQPDSWDGSTPVTGDIVQPTDSTAWGFPMSLSTASKESIKNDILKGDGFGISFIRFPMGFAYRGYRNIDQTTGLAKNIGQRWEGQNTQLHAWFSNIIQAGGGLDVEYWCPAPHWLTGGAYYNSTVNNELWAGGSYSRTTTLASIRTSDPTQYANQIDAFTDAVVNDLEYVHQNVAPVRMYTLAAEPTGSGQLKYGHCHWDTNVYNDVFASLHPKVLASTILSTYNSKTNDVLMHLCADDTGFTIGPNTIANHSSWIWGYSHDVMRPVSGENGIGADQIKDLTFPTGSQSTWKNVFMCEYEYFSTTSKTDEYRFSNNVVRLIFELAYRKARTIMPVIHICKPTGQTSSQTNTVGYCLYAVDMTTGNYTVNTWAYNSWKMFNDNLPIGAELVTGGDGGQSNAGYVVFEKDGKTYVFLGNYSSSAKTITLTFNESKSFNGKLYNLTNLGTVQTAKSGTSIDFVIPAYSGLVYVEELDGLLSNRLLIWHDEFNGAELDTNKWSNVYGNYRNYNWNSPDITRNTDVTGGILEYWTAKDYPNQVSNFSGAYIHTNNKFEFRYGRIEAKMRFPSASPHHTTFWTLGSCGEVISTGETTLYDDTKGVNFPSCGEIDIAEYDNGTVGARMHWSNQGFDTKQYSSGGNIASLTSSPTDWHIYSCEWTATAITFYVDGVQKGTWNTSNATVNGWNPFNIPHYLIFDCISALGGTITWDIAKTDVAWVRVYAPADVTEYITETAISIANTLSISVGQRSYLTPTFTPSNPSDMTIEWSSGNEEICTCYGGMVIGVGTGTTIVTAKTKHGYTATCTVTVS